MNDVMINCGGFFIRADEVLFAHANTGDTCEVHLRCGKSVIVKVCYAAFISAWQDATGASVIHRRAFG